MPPIHQGTRVDENGRPARVGFLQKVPITLIAEILSILTDLLGIRTSGDPQARIAEGKLDDDA